jgi:hypothetical protein
MPTWQVSTRGLPYETKGKLQIMAVRGLFGKR